MSEVKVNKLSPRSGTTVTIGDSGDTINIVGTLQNNGSALTGDISSVVAGTGLSGGGTSGDVTINIEAAQPTITSLGTITTFRSTGIDDNADALAMTIDSSEQIGIGTTSPQNTLHVVKSAISGVSYRTNAPLIVENNSSTEIQILSANSGDGQLRFGDADSNFRGAITYAHADDTMSFATNGANQVKINSNGVMSVADGIALGVGLNNTSSNVLNDYEEGTWTPANPNISLTEAYGRYTKIGNLVTIRGSVVIPTTSDSNQFTLSGLPFTVSNTDANVQGNISLTTIGTDNAYLVVVKNNTTMRLVTNTNSAIANSACSGDFINFSVAYTV